MEKFYINKRVILGSFLILLILLSVVFTGPEKDKAYDTNLNGAVVLTDSIEKVSLDHSALIMKDKKEGYTVEEVAAPPIEWEFMPANGGLVNTGVSNASYWLQFNILNESAVEEWLLELPNRSVKQATLYSSLPDGSYSPITPAQEMSANNTEYTHPNLILPVNSSIMYTSSFYLHIETDGYLQLPLMIWSKEALQAQNRSATALVGSMIGIGIMVSIFYLGKFIRHRKRIYVYFLGFALSISYGLLSNAGFTLSYIWPEYPWLNGKLVYASTILTSIFALLLTESFLDARRHIPTSINIIKTLTWANFLLLFILVITEVPISMILPFSLLSSAVLIFILSAVSWNKEIQYARFYTIGSVLFLLGTGISACLIFGLLTYSTEANNAVYYTLAASVFLFAISLSDKEAYLKYAKVQREKEAVERQRLAMETLKHASERKDEILAITSHGLRTPLYGMIGIAENLQETNAARISPVMNQQLDIIISNGKTLAHMINSILDFSKQKKTSLDIHVEPMKIHKSVDKVLEICNPLVNSDKVRLYETVPHNLPAAIADPERFRQILYNLVENAIKTTESGEIVISAKKSGKHLTVSVRDTGKGIEKEKLPLLFEKIYSDDEKEQGSTGTGLGLNITKKLVELHGGWLRVDSIVGTGTTFSFTLPIYTSNNETAARTLEINNPPEQSVSKLSDSFTSRRKRGGQIRILVVEHEQANREALINQLKEAGFSVFGAKKGAEAVRLLEEQPIDLIILDWSLADMSGNELCRHIRKDYSLTELPILMLSDKEGLPEKTEAFTAGANDYLLKPCDKEEFLLRVDTLSNLRVLTKEITNMNYLLERNVKERTLALEISNMNLVTVNDEIQEMEKSRNEMLSTISHELGTPITLIHSYIQAVKESIIDEKNPRYLDMIHKKLLMLERLTEDLVELSKYKSGNMTLRFKNIRVDEWLDRLIEGMEADITQSGRIFEYQESNSGKSMNDFMLSIDINRIDQVFSNILWNAVKHTSPNDGKISIHTEIIQRPKEKEGVDPDEFDGEVLIKISDTGSGIPENILPHIFDRFFKRNLPDQQQGSGLGLAISKEIILSHKGEIWAESEVGKGSVFCIALPLTIYNTVTGGVR